MEVRLSHTLHKPWLLVVFEAQEWYVIFVSFYIAMVGQGLWWFGVVVFPYVFIKVSRKQKRGAIQHWLSMFGLYKLQYYPPLYEREYSE